MQRRIIKTLCLIFAVMICLGGLAACRMKGDPLAKSEFDELRLDGLDRIEATVTLDRYTVEARDGQKAYFTSFCRVRRWQRFWTVTRLTVQKSGR